MAGGFVHKDFVLDWSTLLNGKEIDKARIKIPIDDTDEAL